MKVNFLELAACALCMLWTGLAWGANPAPAHPQRAEGEPQANSRVVATPLLPPIKSALDSEPIGPRSAPPAGANGVMPPRSQGLELPRVGAALAVVIALILVLRWGGKKLFQQPGAARATRVVQVLARSPLSPRNSILLVRVGRRVIVVGDSGAQMNPLAEISDPEEVASLMGQLQDERSDLSSKAFSAVFRRAKGDMPAEEADSAHEGSPAAGMPDPGHAETAVDPAISATRDEITGLMEKIRSLSTHFQGKQA